MYESTLFERQGMDMDDYTGYGKADFGDKRLSNRLPRILEQLSSDPTASISAACGDPYQAKAIYRFTGNDGVTTDAITKITREVTMDNITAAKPPVLLVLQDTSELNFSNLEATNGLGSIAGRKSARGIEIHSGIATSEDGEIFGLLAQKIWTRPPEMFGKSDERSKKVPIEEKESYKWLETMDNVGTGFPEGTQVVYVCDREADIYEMFCKAEKEGKQYLCRRRSDRNIEEDGAKKLEDYGNALPEAGRITLHIPRDSHTKRKARDAEVAIKYGKCRITKPANFYKGDKYPEMPESVEINIIMAVEIDPPEGQEKIYWQLLTNVATESFEDAVTRIQWYTRRWQIEIFHRTLKSGCKVEELQSESAEKLKKLVAIYSIIALQIMLLSYMARTHPEITCEISFTEEEWKILYRVANKTNTVPDKAPTIGEAVVMVAKLGGFLARKSDGDPGVTVIWRGLTKFYTIMDAVPYLL